MDSVFSPSDVEALLSWYEASARDLPWRKTRDPYCIWISEIMLQQTRVEAVKRYYVRFLTEFPDLRSLAKAEEDRLLKLWEGLGYYSRARNLQAAAKQILSDYRGVMPRDVRELRRLKGIGDYTAGAIASIAYGIPEPAVDGNVLRVVARFTGSREDVTLPQTKKAFSEGIRPCIPPDRAASFTQAMIEIGATVCVPNGEAKCDLCPLALKCKAKREGTVAQLPVKSAKKPRRVENLTVMVIRDGERTALRKRPEKGLLAGLYELPNLPGHLTPDELTSHLRRMGFDPIRVTPLPEATHIFTHIEWHMIGYAVRITPEFDGYHSQSGMDLIPNGELVRSYAVPSAFSAYTKYLREE